jgi:DNA (cytosine-5)-methyltransferase 1
MSLVAKYNINIDFILGRKQFEESAVITHYAITKNQVYKKDAIAKVVEILSTSHKDQEITNKAAESAIDKWMFEFHDIPFPGPQPGFEKFTFIDLFAGIGGFRMAMQAHKGLCVFSSEYDKYSQQTYRANYGEVPFGDITSQEVRKYIPKKFDVLCGGFPCQPFSLAGVSKKLSLGKKHGFEDEKQGNLFFHVADIIDKHRPKAFFLENVKNLVSHDKGNTFKIIKDTLEGLEYSFDKRVLDGKHFVPQHRERTIMVGFDKRVFGEDIKFDFDKVAIPDASHKIKDILDKSVEPKYTLTDHLWDYLQEYARKHKANGNGFGFGLVDLNSITRTISARYHKDGSEILIPQKNKNPRRLTPKECALLQGYPSDFIIPVSDTQAYRQFGNSVVMPLIKAVGMEIVKVLKEKRLVRTYKKK